MGTLDGKVAVITGSTRGIGLGIAEAYAREGAELVVSSRSQAAVDKAVNHLREAGSKAVGLACDVSQQEQVLALANIAMQNFGKVDIWFNSMCAFLHQIAGAGVRRQRGRHLQFQPGVSHHRYADPDRCGRRPRTPAQDLSGFGADAWPQA